MSKIKSAALYKALRRGVSLMLCCAILLSFAGCWGRKELNSLGIVLGTALDLGDKPESLQISAQVVKPGALKNEGGSSEKAYINLHNTDDSINSAVTGLTHMNNRTLYFSHNQILIFSQELAKRDMLDALDAFSRAYESRMNVYILISRGEAAEVLEEDPELEKIPAAHIAETVENQKANSESVIVTMRDFNIATLSKSRAPVAPIIETYNVDDKMKIRLSGTAVFKEGKMIGELDAAQTRGLMLTLDKAQRTTRTLSTEWGQVVLQTRHEKSELKVEKAEDGTFRIKLKINGSGYVSSNETQMDLSTSEKSRQLEAMEAQAVRADVENALKQAHALSADIFGFGEAISGHYPKDWEKLEDNWDSVFKQLPVDIEIDISLDCTGGMNAPVIPGGRK
jgi:spore germination protein KC